MTKMLLKSLYQKGAIPLITCVGDHRSVARLNSEHYMVGPRTWLGEQDDSYLVDKNHWEVAGFKTVHYPVEHDASGNRC